MDSLQSLQNSLSSNVTSNITSSITDQVNTMIGWLVVPSLIVTGIILALYIARMIHRHKVDKAIFEIRDTLREMKVAQHQSTASEAIVVPDSSTTALSQDQ